MEYMVIAEPVGGNGLSKYPWDGFTYFLSKSGITGYDRYTIQFGEMALYSSVESAEIGIEKVKRRISSEWCFLVKTKEDANVHFATRQGVTLF